jgi:hypothetical protein
MHGKNKSNRKHGQIKQTSDKYVGSPRSLLKADRQNMQYSISSTIGKWSTADMRLGAQTMLVLSLSTHNQIAYSM